MAERMDGSERTALTAGDPYARTATTEPRNIEEARDALAATRQRISRDLDVIEHRLRGTAAELRARLDLLEPARARIRANVWTSLGLAFGAGVLLAVLTGHDHHGRRRLPARVIRKTAVRMPGALLQGARKGVATRMGAEWKGRPTLPRQVAESDPSEEARRRAG